jgi:hypothetical protein
MLFFVILHTSFCIMLKYALISITTIDAMWDWYRRHGDYLNYAKILVTISSKEKTK